jgi:hypothetical protein
MGYSVSGISNPLQACCGFGGSYNFNTDVTCGSTGSVDGVEVDLTVSCFNPESYGSWDGIHLSQIINRAAATAFLSGKYIEPNGGMHCTPDTSNWYTHNLSMLVPTLSGCQEDSSKVQRVQFLNHFPPWQLVPITHLFSIISKFLAILDSILALSFHLHDQNLFVTPGITDTFSQAALQFLLQLQNSI